MGTGPEYLSSFRKEREGRKYRLKASLTVFEQPITGPTNPVIDKYTVTHIDIHTSNSIEIR